METVTTTGLGRSDLSCTLQANLIIGQVSLKGLIASTDELARRISRCRIADTEEAKTKRALLDYLSISSESLIDCCLMITETLEATGSES